jgi:hypothetical protein
MVESQHIAATMKPVDDRAEQDLLKTLLESSKPAQVTARAAGIGAGARTHRLDYLLATPFRYDPRRGGSRFRSETDPGVFHGAETVRTAAAELGYWRWRFLDDAVDLERLGPVPHTAFRTAIATQAVDLQRPPFDTNAGLWQHPRDYGPTQRFARVVHETHSQHRTQPDQSPAAEGPPVHGILYRSVHDPEPAWCLALLSPEGFAERRPQPDRQTWYLAVTPHEVMLRRDTESMQFDTAPWKGA